LYAKDAHEKPILVLDPGGHSADILGLVFTPDGRTLISCSRDGSVRLWDVAGGGLLRVLLFVEDSHMRGPVVQECRGDTQADQPRVEITFSDTKAEKKSVESRVVDVRDHRRWVTRELVDVLTLGKGSLAFPITNPTDRSCCRFVPTRFRTRPMVAGLLMAITAVNVVSVFPGSPNDGGGTAREGDATSQSPRSWPVVKRAEGLFGPLEVVESPYGRAILCNGVVQTLVPLSGLGLVRGTLLRGRDYTELVPYFRPDARQALLIGVGGGLHAHALAAYGIKTHGVDVDPTMIALAREYFGLTIDVDIADGRAFLARTRSRYDTIILDAFVGAEPVGHLHTQEAFALVAQRLEPGGVVVVHVIGHPQHATTQAVARTLETVFPRVVAARSGLADERQHIYLFASRRPLELLPEYRLKLEQYGFKGSEIYAVDTRQASPLTDGYQQSR
jgi:spermidine synthase